MVPKKVTNLENQRRYEALNMTDVGLKIYMTWYFFEKILDVDFIVVFCGIGFMCYNATK